MKLPKFNFGQMVTAKGEVKPWPIKGAYQPDNGSEYVYVRGDAYEAYRESDLEIYQEPQRKKLYAYSVDEGLLGKTSEVRLFKKELSENWKAFVREPEYDIEYPEAKE